MLDPENDVHGDVPANPQPAQISPSVQLISEEDDEESEDENVLEQFVSKMKFHFQPSSVCWDHLMVRSKLNGVTFIKKVKHGLGDKRLTAEMATALHERAKQHLDAAKAKERARLQNPQASKNRSSGAATKVKSAGPNLMIRPGSPGNPQPNNQQQPPAFSHDQVGSYLPQHGIQYLLNQPPTNPQQYHQPMSPQQALVPGAQPPIPQQNPNQMQMLSQQYAFPNGGEQMIRELQTAHRALALSAELLSQGLQTLHKFLPK